MLLGSRATILVYSSMASWSTWPEGPPDLAVAQRAQIDAAEQLVGVEVVGVLLEQVLGGDDRFLDLAGLEVEIGESVVAGTVEVGSALSASLYSSMARVAYSLRS